MSFSGRQLTVTGSVGEWLNMLEMQMEEFLKREMTQPLVFIDMQLGKQPKIIRWPE